MEATTDQIATIAALNAEFRGKPKPTNVLSWPTVEFEPHAPGARPELPDTDELGDIAIAYETCQREAEAQGKPFSDHATHLLVHAMLHLAGFDHIVDADAETMEDARAMIAAVDAAGKTLMVHENFRWQSAIRAAIATRGWFRKWRTGPR